MIAKGWINFRKNMRVQDAGSWSLESWNERKDCERRRDREKLKKRERARYKSEKFSIVFAGLRPTKFCSWHWDVRHNLISLSSSWLYISFSRTPALLWSLMDYIAQRSWRIIVRFFPVLVFYSVSLSPLEIPSLQAQSKETLNRSWSVRWTSKWPDVDARMRAQK